MTDRPSFYEFFAGGGMARVGLGAGWDCLFANDFSPMKAETYRANWGDGDLACGDVAHLAATNLPGTADLAWASREQNRPGGERISEGEIWGEEERQGEQQAQ